MIKFFSFGVRTFFGPEALSGKTPESAGFDKKEQKKELIQAQIQTELQNMSENPTEKALLLARIKTVTPDPAFNGTLASKIRIAFITHSEATKLVILPKDIEKQIQESHVKIGEWILTNILSQAEAIATIQTKVSQWLNWSPAHNGALDAFLNTCSLTKLQKIGENQALLRDTLEREIPVCAPLRIKDETEITRILGTAFTSLSTEQQDILLYRIGGFLHHGSLDEEGVADIFSMVAGLPDIHDKRKILQFFLPTISFQQMKQAGIWTASEYDTILENTFQKKMEEQGLTPIGVTYLGGGASSQENTERAFYFELFKKGAKKDEGGSIATEDITDDTKIEALLTLSSDIQKEVYKKIADYIEKTQKYEEEQRNNISTLNEAFDYIHTMLTIKKTSASLSGIANFRNGKYIVADIGGRNKEVWYIDDIMAVDTSGGRVKTGVTVTKYTIFGEAGETEFLEYKNIAYGIVEKITNNNEKIAIVDNPGFISCEWDKYVCPDRGAFTAIIDEFDPTHSSVPFQVGTSFAYKPDNRADSFKEYVRITAIDDTNKKITFQDFTGKTHTMFWEQFLYMIDKENNPECVFERFGDISTVEKFVHTNNTGLFPDLRYEDNKICVYESGHRVSSPFKGFRHRDKNEYIGITLSSTRDKVTLSFYAPNGEKKKAKKPIGKLTDISLEYLQQYIENNEFTRPITAEECDAVHAEAQAEAEASASKANIIEDLGKKQSFVNKLLQQPNIGNYFTAITSLGATLKNYLEQDSQLKQAEAQYRMFRKMFGEANNLTLGAMSRFAENVSTLIDQRMKQLNFLRAEPFRIEVRRILLTKPPKAFDLLAALICVVEQSGQLYPDSQLKDLQGDNYIWFRQICSALGLDAESQLQKALQKEGVTEKNKGQYISEPILITRLLKQNSDSNPYIQAINGGSKFWKAIPTSTKSQMEKGEAEAKERPSVASMEEYIKGKYKSNEIAIVLGGFEALINKSPDPKNMATAFTWTMSNTIRQVPPELRDPFFKTLFKGLTFHAISFSNNVESMEIYQKTVPIVVNYLARKPGFSEFIEAKDTLEKIQQRRDANPAGYDESVGQKLFDFWHTYGEKLNSVLQGSDTLLLRMLQEPDTVISVEEKNQITSYVRGLAGMQGELLSRIDRKLPSDMVPEGVYDYGASMIFETTEVEAKTYFSFKELLNYMQISGMTGKIDSTTGQRIFEKTLVPFLENIRDNTSEPFRKEQYSVLYEEIMLHLRGIFPSAHIGNFSTFFSATPYLQELARLGFDMSERSLISAGMPSDRAALSTETDVAYRRFLSSTTGTGMSGVAHVTGSTRQKIQNTWPKAA